MQRTVAAVRGDEHAAGTKRKADESNLGDSDRFFKRFNLLTLASGADKQHANSNYYIPVAKPSTPDAPFTSQTHVQAQALMHDDGMQLDDTRDRVYIHNLDEELAEIETEEPRLIFLPDIEKWLSRIPQQVLTGRKDGDSDHEGQQLVLYGVPKSLTMDEGHDSVRKAMVDARQRAREKAAEEARQHDMNCKYDQSDTGQSAETAHGYGGGYETVQEFEEADPDAMDMD